MTAQLQNPIFHNEAKAREWLEARVWKAGRVCPHCGAPEERTSKLEGKAHRAGLYQCNQCRQQFTATVGTLFERSKIPLTKWLLAMFLLSASKKGMSALQLSRMLGVSYKSTWFMMHRIREAMNDGGASGPLGGPGKVVEADETYMGGKEANKHANKRMAIDPENHNRGAARGFGALAAFSARAELLEQAGEVHFAQHPNALAQRQFDTLMKVARRASPRRNDIAHGQLWLRQPDERAGWGGGYYLGPAYYNSRRRSLHGEQQYVLSRVELDAFAERFAVLWLAANELFNAICHASPLQPIELLPRSSAPLEATLPPYLRLSQRPLPPSTP